MHKELGGDMAGTADPWLDPTDQSDIPYRIMSHSEIKTRVLGLAGAALPRERQCPAGAEHLEVFASVAFLGFVSFLLLLFLFSY